MTGDIHGHLDELFQLLELLGWGGVWAVGGGALGESGIPGEWLEGLARRDMIEQGLKSLLE